MYENIFMETIYLITRESLIIETEKRNKNMNTQSFYKFWEKEIYEKTCNIYMYIYKNY